MALAVAATVAIVDFFYVAREARKALKGLNETAEDWKNTAAETIYGEFDGFNAFDMN